MPKKEEKEEYGTWFLSYLCSIGLFEEYEVFFNCLNGKVIKTFCDIPVGSLIFIRMDKKNSMTITYLAPEFITEHDEGECGCKNEDECCIKKGEGECECGGGEKCCNNYIDYCWSDGNPNRVTINKKIVITYI